MFSTLSKKKKIFSIVLLAFVYFVQLYTKFGDVLLVLSTYLIFKKKNDIDFYLLTKVLISILALYCMQLFSSVLMILLFSNYSSHGFFFVFLILTIKIIFLLVFIFIYQQFSIFSLLDNYSTKNTSFLLLYIFLVATLLAYAAHHYQAFQAFIIGIAIFLIIQGIFIVYLFIQTTERQKKKYETQLLEQELHSLKSYMNQLEERQDKLSRFKHDYKNILISLKESVSANQEQKSIQNIQELEEYSANYLSKPKFDAIQCKNIQEPRLKSLIMAKLFEASELNINCHFECLTPFDHVPIPIFDCIRALGISLDNAIEAAKESLEPELTMMIYQDAQQLEFLIQNTYLPTDMDIEDMLKKGVTSKKGHQGLGLTTLQVIKNRNPNLLIQYHKNTKNFSIQLIMQWK